MSAPPLLWRDGLPADPALWQQHAPDLLGCGYRVVLPSPLALAHEQQGAAALADLLGERLDTAPWTHLAGPAHGAASTAPWPVELAGGWPTAPGAAGAAAPPISLLTPLPRAHGVRTATPVDLPWRWPVESATGHLPGVSDLARSRAQAYADRAVTAAATTATTTGTAGAAVGLWWSDEAADAVLQATTAGTALLARGTRWCVAGRDWTPWIARRLAELLGAHETEPTRDDVAAADLAVAVAADGTLTCWAGVLPPGVAALRDGLLG